MMHVLKIPTKCFNILYMWILEAFHSFRTIYFTCQRYSCYTFKLSNGAYVIELRNFIHVYFLLSINYIWINKTFKNGKRHGGKWLVFRRHSLLTRNRVPGAWLSPAGMSVRTSICVLMTDNITSSFYGESIDVF